MPGQRLSQDSLDEQVEETLSHDSLGDTAQGASRDPQRDIDSDDSIEQIPIPPKEGIDMYKHQGLQPPQATGGAREVSFGLTPMETPVLPPKDTQSDVHEHRPHEPETTEGSQEPAPERRSKRKHKKVHFGPDQESMPREPLSDSDSVSECDSLNSGSSSDSYEVLEPGNDQGTHGQKHG